MNAYIRFKWTLTEETPTIKAYDEKTWALTPETHGSADLSIALLRALHAKWVVLLQGLRPADWQRTFRHPETGRLWRLDQLLALYAWHGEHHLGHIRRVAPDSQN